MTEDDGNIRPRRPKEKPEGRRRRGRPRDPEVDQAILRAAQELFMERGIDGMSMEQVAKRAGVAKLTVYRRWPTKVELLLQAANSMRGEVIPDSLISETLEDPLSVDTVRKMLSAQVEMFTRPEVGLWLAQFFAASQRHPALLAAWHEQFVGPRQRLFRSGMERLVAAGVLPADTDLDVLWYQMTGAMITRLLLSPEPPDAEEMRRFLITLARQSGLPIPDDL